MLKQIPAKASKKTFTPQIKPLPLPSKWDLERNELLRQISKLKTEANRLQKRLNRYEGGPIVPSQNQIGVTKPEVATTSNIDESVGLLEEQTSGIERAQGKYDNETSPGYLIV